MKQVRILIDTVNSAFEDNGNYELARILLELSERCRQNELANHLLCDINGNIVGDFVVE